MSERTRPVSVPDLDDLARDPALVAELTPAVARHLLCLLAALQTPLLARAMAPDAASRPGDDGPPVGVAEAARLLGISPTTLYRAARRPPYAAMLLQSGTRKLLFSRQAIAQYIERRTR